MGDAEHDQGVDAVAIVQRAALGVARRNGDPWVRGQAEDIAQDTVEAFLAAGPATVQQPAAWAQTTAARKIADRFREVRRQRGDDGYRPDSLHDADHHVRGDDGTVAIMNFLRDTRILSTSEQAYVRWVIEMVNALLTPREMELITRMAAGQTQAEIASAMSYRSANSVKTTATRIRHKVEAAVGGREEGARLLHHERGY